MAEDDEGAETAPQVRIRLDLSYRGTDFAGWATQPGLRTVQGELESGLAQVLRAGPQLPSAPRVTVAGRTDAGVHARGQVAHVDVPRQAWLALPGRSARPPARALLERLGGVLPPDIVVRQATEAPEGFDARFSALWRRYCYRICDDIERRDPLTRDWTLWHRRSLDVEAMNRASQRLVGLRDFAAFCRPRPGATTVRNLLDFTWQRPTAGPDAGLVVATVRADAFCHSMVRALVGSALAVGEGRQPPEWMGAVLDSRSRDQAAAVAPAHPLVLEEVAYPAAGELAVRAAAIRARRAPAEARPVGSDSCGCD